MSRRQSPRPKKESTRSRRHLPQLDLLVGGVSEPTAPSLRVAGLFAGVGGLELGLRRAGHEANLLCEIEPGAQAVLRHRFPDVPLVPDVCQLDAFPVGTELVVGGFPCQDLSQAGKTAGIAGSRSGLVGEVFRILRKRPVPWLLLENVPFMLQLAKGQALDVIVTALEALGYKWAYRVVDSRAFGLPQRRERVFLLASLVADPRDVLFVDEEGPPTAVEWTGKNSFGFYWTEGVRGLGAAVNAVPTLKGGSTIGIPSPPAIILPTGAVVTPDIRDAERMQGFQADWTAPALAVTKRGHRWKLVGNAVTVDVAAWLGARLRDPGTFACTDAEPVRAGRAWPRAAWNVGEGRFSANVSAWPKRLPQVPIHEFLQYPPTLLSAKATRGFLSRVATSSLRFPKNFKAVVSAHLERVERRLSA